MNEHLPDLDALEALAREATEGPWQSDGPDVLTTEKPRAREVVTAWDCYSDAALSNHEANARYIAAVHPQAVLAMIEEIRRLRQTLAVEVAHM